ncbi:MAG: class I SAM-dependent methyltransferase [Caldilineaceae bacterium]
MNTLSTTLSSTEQQPSYVLGHSNREFERLIQQSRFYGELTEEILRKAGVKSGMAVLDIGCGPGDVALLAAHLVGPTGSVLGIDKSPDAIQTACQRVAQAGLTNVHFQVADLHSFQPVARVDALVGRFVLLYLPDPAAVLRRLSAYVRPGGVIALHEMDMSSVRSNPRLPLFETMIEWILETYRRAKLEIDMGCKLYPTFVAAGLPAPQMHLAARLGAGSDLFVPTYLAQTIRSLLPTMEKLGVASVADVQIDTLAERMSQEMVERQGVMIMPSLIGAWTTI